MNILLFEKSPRDAERIQALLGQIQELNLTVATVDELKLISTSVVDGNADLIMLDLSDENGRALEILNQLRSEAPALPYIVLTSSASGCELFRAAATTHGAYDVLVKEEMTAEEAARSIKHVTALCRLAMLEETSKHQSQMSRLIRAVTESLGSSESLRPMLQKCAQAVVDELDAAFARIWTFEPSQELLVLQASAGLYTHLDGKHSRIPLGSWKIGRIAAQRTPHLTNSVLTDSWVSDPEWAAREGMVAFAGYPLLADDRLVGVIGLFSRNQLSDLTLAGLASVSKIISYSIEQKGTEQELRALSDYYHALLAASADAVVVTNKEGTIVETNLATEKMLDRTREYLIGKHFSHDVLDQEQSIDAFKKTLAQGVFNGFLLHVRTGAGNVIECSVNATTYIGPDGTIAGVIASLRDVTRQLQQEEELRKLVAIIEHSSDAIMSETPEGIVTSWNKGAERLYGYSEEEMLGNSISVLYPHEKAGELSELIETVLKGKSVDHLEARRLRKDGQYVDVSLTLSPVRDDSGNVVGLSAISQDITERKLLEEKLKVSETLFRQICTGALDAIVCMDAVGTITVWNSAAERMFGHKEEFAIGKNLHSLIAPVRYHAAHNAALEIFQKTGRGAAIGKTLELEAVRADGSEFPIELSVSAIQIGDAWNAVGIIRDVTLRRQAELHLKEKEGELIAERESLSKTNELLSCQTVELKNYATQIEMLTQLGEYLQSCNTAEEAHEVVARFGSKLFPESSAALFIFKESRNWLKQVAGWGTLSSDERGFPVDDCWSIRRGQLHSYNRSNPGPRCVHVDDQVRNCLCVPVVLLGEIFGVMYIEWNVAPTQDDEKLVARFTTDMALALSNLRLRKQLKDLSIRDQLTGLFNRRYLEEFFGQEMIRTQRKSGHLSVLMIDIDHFKNFNDNFGHEAGDAVLHELGAFLKKQMRGSDVTCRYGGEEFIVLLPESPTEVAERRADQLRNDIKRMGVRFGDELLPEIHISLGVASYPEHGDTMEKIIRAADGALYEAKKSGRDRVCVAPIENGQHTT